MPAARSASDISRPDPGRWAWFTVVMFFGPLESVFVWSFWSLSRALRHPTLSSVFDEGRGTLGFSYIGNRWVGMRDSSVFCCFFCFSVITLVVHIFFSRTASIVLRPLLTHFINIQAISLFGQSVWGAGTLRTCWSDAACSPCAMYRRGFCNAGMRTLGSPCSCGRWLLGSGTCTRLSKEGLQVLRGESIAQAWC